MHSGSTGISAASIATGAIIIAITPGTDGKTRKIMTFACARMYFGYQGCVDLICAYIEKRIGKTVITCGSH